jgi:signal transduction histidine kinase
MAYILAHEINNPLTGIILGLSTLNDNLNEEENVRTVDSIMKDLKRIQSIVNDFLRPKRKNFQKETLKISVLSDIIDDIMLHLSGQLSRQQIVVERDLCQDEYDLVLDRDGIHRAVLNIMLNSVQALPRGGKIEVASTIVPAENPVEPDFLLLRLVDDGPGITKAKCEMLFKGNYTSRTGGTGLGLTICRNIIRAHGGSLEIDSVAGQGTTVKIFLPVKKGETLACN